MRSGFVDLLGPTVTPGHPGSSCLAREVDTLPRGAHDSGCRHCARVLDPTFTVRPEADDAASGSRPRFACRATLTAVHKTLVVNTDTVNGRLETEVFPSHLAHQFSEYALKTGLIDINLESGGVNVAHSAS